MPSMTDPGTATLELPATVAFHPHLEASDVRVYLALIWFTRAHHDRPTKAGIAELAKVNRNTVASSLHRLTLAGLVEVDRAAAPHQYRLAA